MTEVDVTTSIRTSIGRAPPRGSQADHHTNISVVLFALAGVILPSEVQITLTEGLRFTSGRLAAAVLLIPSLVALSNKGRRLLPCDLLVVATATWMVVSALNSSSPNALSAAGGDALDFLGGYFIARGFLVERGSLDAFVRVLKAFAVIAVVLGILDRIYGRLVVHEMFSAVVGAPRWPATQTRDNIVRVASTFDHAILFGVFCAVAAAILLYWEQRLMRRCWAVGVCFLGCMLARSSAGIMAFCVVIATYVYDSAMSRYLWRWSALWAVLGAFGLAMIVVSEHPLGWLISHATLDPQTGFFRLMMWEAGFAYIQSSPLTGYGYETIDGLLSSVDSVWLVQVLRFGVPMFLLFFSANVAAILPGRVGDRSEYGIRMRTAFTLAILIFMLAGLTVHFWNYTWMFWGLCVGVRASLRERTTDANGAQS